MTLNANSIASSIRWYGSVCCEKGVQYFRRHGAGRIGRRWQMLSYGGRGGRMEAAQYQVASKAP